MYFWMTIISMTLFLGLIAFEQISEYVQAHRNQGLVSLSKLGALPPLRIRKKVKDVSVPNWDLDSKRDQKRVA